jgi:plastocyanin
MLKKCRTLTVVVGALALSISSACSDMSTPTHPSAVTVTTLAETADSHASTVSSVTSSPTVTMLPDLTVTPSRVSVKTGYRVKFVNKSGRYAQIHSYNCSEFQMVNPASGGWVNTMTFRPAGKVCDFFAWERDWSAKIFVGQVEVVP